MRATFADREARREWLIELMGQHGLTCSEVGAMLDRKPQTVRAWRSGSVPVSDHTIALLYVLLERRAA